MSNFAFNDKTSIFELQVKQQSRLLTQYPDATVLQDGRILLAVPDYQKKSEIQKLQRLGVRILDIYAINDEKYLKIMATSEVVSTSTPTASTTEAKAVPTVIEKTTSESLGENEFTPQTPVEETVTGDRLSPEAIVSSKNVIDPNTPWWVEILTEFPRCLYYFGPFESEAQACDHQWGYQEDLEGEGAKGIVVTIKQCLPQILTQEL